MSKRSTGRSCISAALCVAQAACSGSPDPRAAAPVDLEPGLYAIALSGALGARATPAEDQPDKVCVRPGGGEPFARKLAQSYYGIPPTCRATHAPREGNAIAGAYECPTDPKQAKGTIGFAYTGALSAEAVRVEVQMKLGTTISDIATPEYTEAEMKKASAMVERLRVVIEARRTGPCA